MNVAGVGAKQLTEGRQPKPGGSPALPGMVTDVTATPQFDSLINLPPAAWIGRAFIG